MSETTSVNLRIDKELKNQAELLFASLGLNMTTAINVFLRQAVRDQGLPFRISAVRDGEFESVPYKGSADRYPDYESFVADSLKTADLRVAEGKMKYYTAEEIKAGLEELLNEKL